MKHLTLNQRGHGNPGGSTHALHRWLALVVLAAVLSLTACDSDSSSPSPGSNRDPIAPSFTQEGNKDLVVGSTYDNPATGDAPLTYTSSNASVASVDNTGTVTALALGITTISVVNNVGSDSYQVTVVEHQAELSAWVGPENSELILSGNIDSNTQLYTHTDPGCDVIADGESCSHQYQITTSPFIIDTDDHLSLTQPAYAQLHQGEHQAKTLLNAQRFSARGDHQAVYFKGRFWLVGGNKTTDDIWSSADGRNWIEHTSVNSENPNEENLFSGRNAHQLVVFDAPEAAGDTDLGDQLWLIGGEQNNGDKNDIWSSSDGITWTLRTEAAAFSARSYHQVAVFDSNNDGQAELWLLGGFDESARRGDLWTSTDGVTWTEKTNELTNTGDADEPVFSARYGHQLVVFNDGDGDQLWLIGGYDGAYLNDLWSSADGIHWTDEGTAMLSGTENNEAFSPRYHHRVIVFDAEGDAVGPQLWLIGGFSNDNNYLDDVWSSANGTHWTPHTPSEGTRHFDPRSAHQLVVADTNHNDQNELWLIGGETLGPDLNDTWFTTDGNNWSYQSPYADFSPRQDHQVVSFDADDGQGKQFWLVGGYDGSPNNEVWSSPDGVHWARQPAVNTQSNEALFSPRYDHQLVVFDDGNGDQLWLIGGQDDNGGLQNDVWSSPNGIEWTQHQLSCSGSCFEGRYSHQVAVFKDQLWLMGGQGDDYLNDVWSSSDGQQWNKVAVTNSFPARAGHQVVVFDSTEDSPDLGEQLWLIGGGNSNPFNDVWSSTDGVTWTQKLTDGHNGFSQRREHQVVVFDDGSGEQLWLAGGNDSKGRSNDIWSSSDGVQWTQKTGATDFSKRNGHQLLVFKASNETEEKLWLIGGISDKGRSNEVWRSSNGIDWRVSIKNELEFSVKNQ